MSRITPVRSNRLGRWMRAMRAALVSPMRRRSAQTWPRSASGKRSWMRALSRAMVSMILLGSSCAYIASDRREHVHAETPFGIEPLLDQPEVRGAPQVVDLLERVLVGVLGVDHLAGRQRDLERERVDAEALRALADQVHAYAPQGLVVDRAMIECIEVEVAAQLAIDAREDVLVEARGDARGVVVGALERAAVL